MDTALINRDSGMKIIAERSSELIALSERFLSSQDVCLKSKETYRYGLTQFFNYLQENDLLDSKLTRENILEYKHSLKNKNHSASTISAYITVVRQFFNWTESIGVYPNIAKFVKGAKQARGFLKEPLTVDQVKAVLNQIDRSNLQGKRDYAMMNLLVRTGLRTIEVIRANVGDVSQSSGEAVLHIQGKGRELKDEIVILTENTLRPIREYLWARGNPGEAAPLFASISNRNQGGRLDTKTVSRKVKSFFLEVGLTSKKHTAHSLRHTAATMAIRAGAQPHDVQGLMRHSDINMTMRYVHKTNRIENAPERHIDSFLGVAA